MFDYSERDELVRCEICEGSRILIDICGVSRCGWCDGTGMQEARIVTLLAPGEGAGVVDSHHEAKVDMDAMSPLYKAALVRAALMFADYVEIQRLPLNRGDG